MELKKIKDQETNGYARDMKSEIKNEGNNNNKNLKKL